MGIAPCGPHSRNSSSAAAPIRWFAPTKRGSRKSCGSEKRTSTRTAAPTRATRGSSCPVEAGRPGRAPSALLLPPLKVADLGCGEGYLTIEAACWAARVIAVDRSTVVLDRAKGLARRRRVSNVIWKLGALDKLPIKDETVDVALLSQALHHAHDAAKAVSEAARITKPSGRVLVLDLRTHGEEWVRAKLGDRRLGFRDEELSRLLTVGGLRDVRVGVGARKAGDPFTVLIASGTKPKAARKARRRE